MNRSLVLCRLHFPAGGFFPELYEGVVFLAASEQFFMFTAADPSPSSSAGNGCTVFPATGQHHGLCTGLVCIAQTHNAALPNVALLHTAQFFSYYRPSFLRCTEKIYFLLVSIL